MKDNIKTEIINGKREIIAASASIIQPKVQPSWKDTPHTTEHNTPLKRLLQESSVDRFLHLFKIADYKYNESTKYCLYKPVKKLNISAGSDFSVNLFCFWWIKASFWKRSLFVWRFISYVSFTSQFLFSTYLFLCIPKISIKLSINLQISL